MHILEEHHQQITMNVSHKHLSIHANSTENLQGMLRKEL